MAQAGKTPFEALLARKTTLYLDHASPRLAVAGNMLTRDGAEPLPLHTIRRLVLIGRANVDPAMIYALLRSGIALDWLDIHGRPVGLLTPAGGNMDCCVAFQAAFSRSPAALDLARKLILAKVDNCHEILRRRVPEYHILPEQRLAITHAENGESLRGYEGLAAREYFGAWQGILGEFHWQGRHPHPAPDPVNMLLSMGYGLLRNRLASALHHAGLDPRMGFFHERRGRHTALASDLMEPLRALVDTTVITMLRNHELRPDDFEIRAGKCILGRGRDIYGRLIREFEEMFAKVHKFHIDPGDNGVTVERSFNDILDDLAESFTIHVHDNGGCIIPRLAPCAVI